MIVGFVQLNPAVTLDVNEELTLCSALPYPSAADTVPHLAPFTQTGAAAMYVKPCGTLTIWGNKTACFIARRGASSLSLSHALCVVLCSSLSASLYGPRDAALFPHTLTHAASTPPLPTYAHTHSGFCVKQSAARESQMPTPAVLKPYLDLGYDSTDVSKEQNAATLDKIFAPGAPSGELPFDPLVVKEHALKMRAALYDYYEGDAVLTGAFIFRKCLIFRLITPLNTSLF